MTYPYIPTAIKLLDTRTGEMEPEFEGLLSDEDLNLINKKAQLFEDLTKNFTCEMGKVTSSN